MAKQTFKGKSGAWRTLPNGVHIFIPDGQTVDDVVGQLSDSDWESEYSKSQYTDAIVKNFTYADFKYWYQDKITKERVKPAAHAKQVLRNCLDWRDSVDSEYDQLILNGINNNVNEFIINDRGTNWFKRDWWSGKRRIQLDIDNNDKNKILESLSHEIGHAIDASGKGYNFMSDTYKSQVYGMTMSQSLALEFKANLDLETINDEADVFADLMRQVTEQYKDGAIDEREYKKAYFRYQQSKANLADMCQAFYGDDECLKIFGYTPHELGYFNRASENAAAECFAELTSDLFWDREKRFYNLIKQYCPDTIKIYHEIIEEVQNKWKSKN